MATEARALVGRGRKGDPDRPLPSGTTVGKGYEVTRVIGSGACGTVYDAVAPDGRHVALKLMRHADTTTWNDPLRRFVREAQITGALDSAHIVRLLDAGVDPDLDAPYLVMPLMKGFNLASLIRLTGPLQPTVAVRIIRQGCLGLGRAHEAKVIHRDLKPANLFLDHDGSGRIIVRLLDFGLAKWDSAGGDLTKPGMCIGTPYFMAPEQIKHSKDADCRADVWGLGATLYQALCRKWPYEEAKGLADLVVRMRTCDPAPVQDAAPWLDPALATIVHGCLIRARQARCQTVAELAEALRPFAAGTDELRAGMLWPVAGHMRERPLPRAEPPAEWQAAEPTVEPARPKSYSILGRRPGLEAQIEAWQREQWMVRTAADRPVSGPTSLEKVASDLAEGLLPWDAQLARVGSSRWWLATVVAFS